jgi:hypothetical protein
MTRVFKFCIWCIFFVILLFPSLVQSAAFLSNIEDLPLMAGLTEEKDSAILFESSSGRIAESIAVGKISERDVSKFYKETLPQFGWNTDSVNWFWREEEILSLRFSLINEENGTIRVHFKIVPR